MKPKVEGELDLTHLPGEQHITERSVKTVAGTTEDDFGDSKTDLWPSILPREDFTKLQQSAIEHLVANPNARDSMIAEKVGCTQESIRQIRHKVRVFADHDDVPFEIPDEPNPKIKIVSTVWDGDEPSTSDAEEEDKPKESEEALPREEILSKYREGVEGTEIANQLNLSVWRVNGFLGAMKQQGVVVDESQSSDDEDSGDESEGEKEPTTEEEPAMSHKGSMQLPQRTTAIVELDVQQLVAIMESDISTETKEEILGNTTL